MVDQLGATSRYFLGRSCFILTITDAIIVLGGSAQSLVGANWLEVCRSQTLLDPNKVPCNDLEIKAVCERVDLWMIPICNGTDPKKIFL